MTPASQPHPDPDAIPGFVVHRVARVQLRGVAGPLRARIYWPAATRPSRPPALLVFFHAGGSIPGSADALCRGLCSQAGVVVLSASYRLAAGYPYPAALRDATTAMGWAADHAARLDADPGQLLVGGVGAGGRLAAAVALHARDHRWPAITRQVLIHPNLDARQDSPSPSEHADATPLRAPSLVGVAPATMVLTVQDDPVGDDGRRYAARLRQAGVEVEELRYDDLAHGTLTLLNGADATEPMLTDLVYALRQSLEARPRPRSPTRARQRPPRRPPAADQKGGGNDPSGVGGDRHLHRPG